MPVVTTFSLSISISFFVSFFLSLSFSFFLSLSLSNSCIKLIFSSKVASLFTSCSRSTIKGRVKKRDDDISKSRSVLLQFSTTKRKKKIPPFFPSSSHSQRTLFPSPSILSFVLPFKGSVLFLSGKMLKEEPPPPFNFFLSFPFPSSSLLSSFSPQCRKEKSKKFSEDTSFFFFFRSLAWLAWLAWLPFR